MEKEQLIKWIERLTVIKDTLEDCPSDVAPAIHEKEWIPRLLGYIDSAEFIINK